MSHEHDRTAGGVCVGCVTNQVRDEERARLLAWADKFITIYGAAERLIWDRLRRRIVLGEHRPVSER